MRHFSEAYVRPGSANFSLQNNERHKLPDDLAVDVPVLELMLSPPNVDVALGAPVQVNLTLTNNVGREIPVPKSPKLSSSFTSGTVTNSAGMVRAPRLLVVYDCIDEPAWLANGHSTNTSLALLGGPDGRLFQSSRLNTVTAWPAVIVMTSLSLWACLVKLPCLSRPL